ncbi:MAG: hypothetical protein EON61_02355 [Alphaproteobacteria bacterium]|nr:MAG: hypothetical protein EON61_02355 [Alphaproteobacteria bacterium]
MIRSPAVSLLGVLGLAPFAHAQISPPLEDVVIQGEILNRSVGEAIGATDRSGEASDNEIDGEAGIYILTVNEIFFVSGGGGFGHTSNPTRTANDAGGDWYGEFAASAGIATRLGGVADFGAAINVDGRDFIDADIASSRSVSANASIGATLWGPVYGSLTTFGGYAFDDGFGGRTGFYGVAANVSAAFRITDNLLLRPGVGLTRQWSETSENDSLSATASVDAAYVLSPQWLLSGRLSVTERKYDDFYEDVTFVEREDTIVGVSASLVWRPVDRLALAASVAYEDQESSLFLSAFDALDTGLSLSAKYTF